MTKLVLMDIEGTTTSVSFVHEVLFPYSYERMDAYVAKLFEEHHPLCDDLHNLGSNPQAISEKLKDMIKKDVKDSLLKWIQGKIWLEGYESGEIKGHVYEDVPRQLKNWFQQGLKLAIYSSGSIEAQKLLFKNSICGDLDEYISANFDTHVGHKREIESYKNILKELSLKGSDVLFLSDIKEELDAAKATGMKTIQLMRGEAFPSQGHQQVSTFDEIKI